MPIPHWVAKVNKRVTNPVLGLVSDVVPPFATMHHVGRASGRRYRTPIFAFPTSRGFVVALTYGPDVQWLRNVEAGGQAFLVRMKRIYALSDPQRLHGDEGARLIPLWTRVGLRLMHVDEFVVLAAVPV